MANLRFQVDFVDYEQYDDQLMFKITSDGYSVHFNLFLNGKIIGEATITTTTRNYKYIDEIPCYYIHSVGILSTLHNMGYGTILMTFVVKWLKRLHEKYGLDYAMLEMSKDRLEDKIRFYKRVGFVLPQYDDNGITPMFYFFDKNGEKILDEINTAMQKYKNAYDETFSYISKKAEILSNNELYDLIHEKVMGLKIPFESYLKNEDVGRFDAYRSFFYLNFSYSRNFSWHNIFEDLLRKNGKL